MFARWRNSLLSLALLLLTAGVLPAQTDGTFSGFSPYSVFGLGQLHQAGTAWNRGMGGVGIAARNKRFVNIMNPASITARDSLSFMSDFGLNGRMSLFKEGSKQAFSTTLDIDDFVISFPMWRHTAFMVGLTPLSDVGYNISYQEMDVYTGQRQFTSVGNGGTYQAFAAAAATLWNRLSLGAQVNFTFGNISKYSGLVSTDDSYRTSVSGDSLQVNSVTAKFGLQYEQPISTQSYITIGATYKLSSPLRGYSTHYRELGSYDRTRTATTLDGAGLRLGDELGVGLSYRHSDDLLIEADYTRSDWSNSKLDQVKGFSNVGDVVFAPSIGQSVHAGFEFTPNRNDIRYFLRRCTYRAGVKWEQSYYTVDGAHVNSASVTAGMTIPVFRWYNGITVGMELGRRGLATSQVKENYFGFNLGFNIFDVWFQKRSYE